MQSKDPRTNIIDQGNRIPYAFSPTQVSFLFDVLDAARRAGVPAHFSERQGTPAQPLTGIMLDFDVTVTDAAAALNERHVSRLAATVARRLYLDLEFPDGPATVHAFSIVKPAPALAAAGDGGEAQYRYGFHLLFPGVWVSRGYKKHLIRELRKSPSVARVMRDLGAVGDPAACLDSGSASVPVLFVGSCKRGGTPYRLGPAFEVGFDGVCDPAELNPTVEACPVAELEARYNLVAELSLCAVARYPDGRPPLVPAAERPPRPALAPRLEDLARRTRDGILEEGEILCAEHALATLTVADPEARHLHQVLDILDESYSSDRNKWRNVIFALANTSETYKPLAEWFSLRCPEKWADGGADALDALWEEAVGRRGRALDRPAFRPLTKRSIFRWAQECNPDRFRQVAQQAYFSILAQYVYTYGGVLEHYMVAKVLHAMLGNKFAVDVVEEGRPTYCWYEFVLPGQAARPGEVWKWRQEADPDELRLYISESLVDVFTQVAQNIDDQRENAATEERAKYYAKLGAAFQGSRRKIFNHIFKNGVLKEAHTLFRRRGFAEALDQDPHLLGVGNGVLVLGPECRLIDHHHEYLVRRFTRTVYRPLDPSDPWTRLMLDAVEAIIPEPDVRDWFLFFAASSLAGGVKAGILFLWYGGGANGKTFIMRMIAKVLGDDYAKKLNISIFTSERESADRPNSAIMQLKGRRWGYVEETQKAEVLNIQRLKEIVNPGEISGRELNQRQETFENTANIAAGKNHNFIIETTDHGTWRRIRYYTAKTKFVAHPDPDNPYEKKEDPRYLEEYVNDPDCLAAFLGLLAHYYERLQREYGGNLKRVPCPTLDRETEAYRNQQDTINRFITETVVRSPDHPTEYDLADVSTAYNNWYNANVGGRTHVASETIQELRNSALAPHIYRAPNRAVVLRGCRILERDSRTVYPGESYFGCRAARDEAPAPSATPVCREWWAAPRGAAPRTARAADVRGADDALFDGGSNRDLPERWLTPPAEEVITEETLERIVRGPPPRQPELDDIDWGDSVAVANDICDAADAADAADDTDTGFVMVD